jgi:uncharacterized protein YndB with AHSA1/START domain
MSDTTFRVSDDKKRLIVERTFDAPKSRVWKAYSTRDLLLRWWGPRGWETIIKRLEFENGGTWHYGMKCIDANQGDWFGKTSWGQFVYENIRPEDSFEYTDVFCDEEGNPTPGMPSSHTVVKLVEREGRTTVTTTTSYTSEEALSQVLEMGMKEGLSETLDKLEEVLRAEA